MRASITVARLVLHSLDQVRIEFCCSINALQMCCLMFTLYCLFVRQGCGRWLVQCSFYERRHAACRQRRKSFLYLCQSTGPISSSSSSCRGHAVSTLFDNGGSRVDLLSWHHRKHLCHAGNRGKHLALNYSFLKHSERLAGGYNFVPSVKLCEAALYLCR
jgi:hypothetical protein